MYSTSKYCFKTAPLPKPIFDLLKQIAQSENLSQRAVVVAGVMALVRLRTVAPEHASDVLTEAGKLCPKRDGAPRP